MKFGRNNFRYLNREGKWLNFHWSGLEVSSKGALQLLSSPRFASPSSLSAKARSAPVAPSGIAIDESGRTVYSEPDENRIVVTGGCDPDPKPLNCLTQAAGLSALRTPRGLLILRNPGRLVIVDSGNDRLLFYDLADFQLREVWGRGAVNSLPATPDAPDQFDDPWGVAADEDERHLYVLDAGNERVLKFARTGDPDTAFLANMQSSGLVSKPGAIAVAGSKSKTRIFVSDLTANAIYIFDDSGHPILDPQGCTVALQSPGMGNVLALAVNNTRLFVGDNAQQQILAFALTDDFSFAGEAAGFRGFSTALAIDSQNDKLLVATGDAAEPLVLEAQGSYLGAGFLWSEAISAVAGPVTWNRLRASVTKTAGAHVEFHYAISGSTTPPPVDLAAEDPFQSDLWRSLPIDVDDFLLADQKSPYIFIGAGFFSDRTSTPLLTQMRVEFDSESYTQYLPQIYREPTAVSDFFKRTVSLPPMSPEALAESYFLKRFVSLFQGLFEDIEHEVDSLERYFDPFAAPPEALTWLATWLAVELDQDEPEARIRQSIARAFRRYRWRGTIAGLRLALLEDAGVHATISEPISASSFWAMPSAVDCAGSAPDSSLHLGRATHLTSMEPGGAVLGSTAHLDHSYLITDAQFGEPVFTGAAFQFLVEVYRAEVKTEARVQLVKEIIEREKPAHTMYRLTMIESKMRAGFQSRIGVDTIVSGPAGPTALGRGGGLRLGGPLPLRLGTSRLGQDLKL